MVDDFRAPRFFIDPLELQTVKDTLISEIQLRDLNGLDSGLDPGPLVARFNHLLGLSLLPITEWELEPPVKVLIPNSVRES